ncbi:endonuclease IV [Marinitoga sp. 1135]|uniref:Probable endonuclease 4 n=1 Tax=Marinitoga piezophila (strain DSM 14283 / JCM 11233 / KA3) TaxID=443254 RepID=H2J2Y7_MARPK|nr:MULTISPECIES: deoxyribonuclease IV [Marinitoga]AEX85678.1 apurinic endonuclease APN1 [Marinitoga piezophila KA3]NUU95884.1 endonuclease IV [Marinitoga sp. 1135]NUU97794.1 endonuclease IV [Marinitoga sp. 1138]
MVKIGAHMSTSKGFRKVPEDTINIGGNTFQIFSHSPRTWKVKQPDEKDVEKFKYEMIKNNIAFEDVLVHSGYLINLASHKDENWQKSINLMIEEIKVTAKLGIKYFNVHPGSHLGKGDEYGYDRIAKALDIIFNEVKDLDIYILLENVAKKGGNIGWKIEQLGEIINRTSFKDRIGMTYDTCHGFDSNYDIRNKDGVRALLDEIEKYLGLDKLKMIHLNDSKFPLGAGKDRHEFIGKGEIGIEGFKTFFSFEEILKIPMHLETPGDDQEHAEDIITVRKILENL